MIRRLLVANRGEIARRIMASASAAGISTVAVYAPSDADAPFVADADVAVALLGDGAAGTYLDVDQLLAAAAATGADAVHPGYGFLSERAGAAAAVVAAGLTWVGPPPQAIAAMGDKLAAKRLMAAAGVPVLVSHQVGDNDLPGIDADEYPVLVKAAAGGGGKGMRIVAHPAELAGAVASARGEAERSFGDPTVFVERYVSGARHVEIQVLADNHGTVLHLHERECSIQRRHQKIIEESPSPALDPRRRAAMAAAAVDAARAVGYRSAGTVEFVLEPSGAFWFLEVNTRLQVEHPVTEAVTGIDLVRAQLRVAEGHPLELTQDQVTVDGHAIEARLYAEDPATGFLPSTGTVVDWVAPAGPGIRVDSGIEAGDVVGAEWDPLLAKVVAHAATRSEAALALARALARCRLRGLRTNRDHLVEILRSDPFLAGDTPTTFVDDVELPRRHRPTDAELALAALAATLAARQRRRSEATVLASLPAGWRNSVMPSEVAEYRHDDRRARVDYRSRRDGSLDVAVTVACPGETAVAGSGGPAESGGRGGAAAGTGGAGGAGAVPPVRVLAGVARVARWDGRTLDVEVAGRRHHLDVLDGSTVGAPGRYWVQGPSGDVELEVLPRFPERAAQAVGGGLTAPLPGRVLAVHVAVGATVSAGAALVVVEAMKMEHRIAAPHPGVVSSVRVAAGDQVAAGDLLVVIDPLDPAPTAAAPTTGTATAGSATTRTGSASEKEERP